MLTFTILSLPSMSLAMSSSEGPIMRQGPHHSAQKSTRTGVSDFKTSCSKEASVALTVMVGSPKNNTGRSNGPAPPLVGKLGTGTAGVKMRRHKALIYLVFFRRFPSVEELLSTAGMPVP